MDEQRIEVVLKTLGQCVPKTPEKTLEKMIRTVNSLERERPLKDAHSEEKQPQKENVKVIDNKEKGGPVL